MKRGVVAGAAAHIDTGRPMRNNFAFGGTSTSLVFRRWND